MEKINFQNNITKANAETFNTMQDNIEDAINDVIPVYDDEVSTESTNGVENQAITNYVDSQIQDVKDYTDIKILDIYSTIETIIGTWTDGKPLYRITLNIPAQTVPNDHWISLMHNLGVKYYIEAKGMVLVPGWDGNIWEPIPRVVTDAISTWGIGYGDLNPNEFRVQMGTNYSSVVNGFVTFIYTKESDYI